MGMCSGRDGFLLSIDDADYLLGTAKIVIVNGTYHLVSGTATYQESVLRIAMGQVEEMGGRFLRETANPPPFISRKLEEMERMCMEATRTATHAFISNIPKSLMQDHRLWKSDIMFAIRYAIHESTFLGKGD